MELGEYGMTYLLRLVACLFLCVSLNSFGAYSFTEVYVNEMVGNNIVDQNSAATSGEYIVADSPFNNSNFTISNSKIIFDELKGTVSIPEQSITGQVGSSGSPQYEWTSTIYNLEIISNNQNLEADISYSGFFQLLNIPTQYTWDWTLNINDEIFAGSENVIGYTDIEYGQLEFINGSLSAYVEGDSGLGQFPTAQIWAGIIGQDTISLNQNIWIERYENRLFQTDISEVPLPAGIYLFLSGLVGLGLMRGRNV